MAKKKNKKKGSKKVLVTIISIFVVIIVAAWFLGGKPYIELGAEGISLVQTEEPLVVQVYNAVTGIDEEEQAQSPVVPEPVEVPAQTSAVEGRSHVARTGTSGSNPAADQGHSENDPLFWGNPTDSFTDTSLAYNYLMIKPQYALSYNTKTLCPNWVAWHLGTENMGEADRMDDFRPDSDLPQGWYGIKKADYQYNKYGFDRGHVCPSADRTTSKDDNSMTFLMTNMVPQSPDNNRIIWMHFENFERELAKEGNELYIVAGPYGTGGTSSKGTFDEIPVTLKSGEVLHMNVP